MSLFIDRRARFINLVTAGYTAFGLAWVGLSDLLLPLLEDRHLIVQLSLFKGTFFVVASAVLLYLALGLVPDAAQQGGPAVPAWSRFPLTAWVGRRPSRWLPYGLAVVLVLAMLAVRQAIAPHFGDRPLLPLFTLPIVLSAMVGGVGPGLLATALAALAANYLALAPVGSLAIDSEIDLFQWALLVINGIGISLLAQGMHWALSRARADRALMQSLISSTPDAITVKDREGRYLMVNPTVTAILGLSADQVVGKRAESFLPPDEAAEVEALDQQVLDTLAAITVTQSITTPNGVRHYQSTRGPLLGPEGEVLGLFGMSRDVTERKRVDDELERHRNELQRLVDERTQALVSARDQLAERERFLHSIADAVPGMVGYWDQGLKCRFANHAFERWFGRSPAEMAGIELTELLGPDLSKRHELQIRGALAGARQHFELQLGRSDGSFAHMLADHIPDVIDGEVKGFTVVINDVSDLKRAESVVREQARQLEDLYNETPCGYHSLDANGTVVRINDAELRWLGRSRDEVVGRNITEFFTPASVDTFRQNFPALQSTDSVSGLELELVRRDGSLFPVLASATVIRDAMGRFVSTRTALVDYSRLRQEQETLRRVLAASPMAVRIAGVEDHNVRFMNRAFCELVRRPESAAQGMDVSACYVDQTAFADIVGRLRAGEMVLNRLVELHLPDQPEVPHVWALASYMTILYAGQPCVLAWLFDVTQLQEARSQAEAANRAKSSFLANMSHEIRTPLDAITGLTHLLLRDERDDSQRDRLKKVQAASGHLLQVINDILDLSKIEAGRMILERREFVLGEVVHRAIELVRPRADEKHLELVVDTDQLPARLIGDATRLTQMLVNLLANAVKFTETGWVRLSCRLAQDGGEELLVRFEVQDSGPGIAPELQARLFEAFEQGDMSTTRLHGGTGLGLALTRHFAIRMGGTTGLSSEPGRGSTFWFTARVQRAHGVVTQEPSTVWEAGTPERKIRECYAGAHVLVAEDHAVNAEVATVLLKGVGLCVDVASNGLEAVELALLMPYDAILMDMQMPGIDGLEATRRIRRAGVDRVPIIAMTANAFGEDRAACLEAGMNDHLAKPVDPQTLLSTLLRWWSASSRETPAGVPKPPAPATSEAGVGGAERQVEALAAIPGYSLAKGLSTTGDRPDLLLQLLGTFATTYRLGAQALEQALHRRDLEALRQEVHAIRGACVVVGAVGADELTSRLETTLQRDPQTDAMWAEIGQSVAQVSQALVRLVAAFGPEPGSALRQ